MVRSCAVCSKRFLIPSQVCGTPASGKTTLARLLYNHIHAEEPTTNLIMISTWNKNEFRWEANLAAHNYNFNGPNTLIIDEAQLMYWDFEFWNTYLKEISFRPRDRIILFVGWGHPTGRVSVKGTNMSFQANHTISLRPIDHQDELPPAGLFLSADEFSEMVKVAFPNGRFTEDFLDHVLHLTAGHAGAVHDILRIVMDDAVSLCIKPLNSLTILSSHTANLRRKLGNTPWKSFRPNFLSMTSGRVSIRQVGHSGAGCHVPMTSRNHLLLKYSVKCSPTIKWEKRTRMRLTRTRSC
jgi:hypothetical protein